MGYKCDHDEEDSKRVDIINLVKSWRIQTYSLGVYWVVL